MRAIIDDVVAIKSRLDELEGRRNWQVKEGVLSIGQRVAGDELEFVEIKSVDLLASYIERQRKQIEKVFSIPAARLTWSRMR